MKENPLVWRGLLISSLAEVPGFHQAMVVEPPPSMFIPFQAPNHFRYDATSSVVAPSDPVCRPSMVRK